jgi:hypothetical protein
MGVLPSAAQRFRDACLDPDPAGRKLQAAIAKLLKDSGKTIVYLIAQPLYSFEHLFPLLCAAPGPIAFGVEDKTKMSDKDKHFVAMMAAMQAYGVAPLLIKASKPQLEAAASSGKVLLVGCQRGAFGVFGWPPEPSPQYIHQNNLVNSQKE